MARVDPFQATEMRMRLLLEGEGLPPPDAVEHRETSIVLLWNETKTAVVIDVFPEPPEDG